MFSYRCSRMSKFSKVNIYLTLEIKEFFVEIYITQN